MTTKRELESVSAILMLLAGIFLFLNPIQSFARDIQRGSLSIGWLYAVLIGILAIVSFIITWKGNSTAGGLLSLILSLFLLFYQGVSGLESVAAAFLLAGGLMAMLGGRNPPVVYTPR